MAHKEQVSTQNKFIHLGLVIAIQLLRLVLVKSNKLFKASN